MTCEKCGHRPSERTHRKEFDCGTVGYYHCDCPCHDAADAGPALLAEARRIHDRIVRQIEAQHPMLTEIEHDDYVRLARAIALAEPKVSSSPPTSPG